MFMAQKSKKLGEILYGAKLVPKEALIEAIKTAKNTNKRLGEVLIEHGHIDEDTLAKALSKQFGIKYINLDSVLIPGDATSMVPEDLMKRHNIIPLGKTDGKLQLVIGDPTDLETLDTLKFRLNRY
jgi:type IV pilus assembly protein PilB